MLKQFYTYGFVLLYLVAMARPVMPLAEYLVYEDYIAEFLCINKDNKTLECNGKCYLMQMLQEQNEEKHHNVPRIAMEEYPIGFVELLALSFSQRESMHSETTFTYSNPYSFLFISEQFHPPSVVA